MNARDDTGLSGDKMLWIAGGAVGVIAIAFLAFMNMGAPDTTTAITTLPSIEAEQTSVDNGTEVEATVQDFSVQLNRARLAVDAQMLTEPEGYSAWSIYTEFLMQMQAILPQLMVLRWSPPESLIRHLKL